MKEPGRQETQLKVKTAAAADGIAAPIAVVVLGMHRSGTSALARVLSLLGCGLPEDLMDPIAGNNDTGFWESRDIADFNDALLAAMGSHWDDWRAMPEAWCDSPGARDWYPRARDLLASSFAGQALIVLKDPRICRLLPFWQRVIEGAGYQPRLVLPLRHPLEVAASLRRRDAFSPRKGQVLWLRHVLDAERDSRSLPRVVVRYATLLDDWRGELGRIRAGLGLALPRWSATAEVEIDRFLRDDLRHNQTGADLASHPEVAGWVRDAYPLLLRLTHADADAPAIEAALDGLRAEFDAACQSFGSMLRAEELAREQAQTARAQAETRLQVLEHQSQERVRQVEILGTQNRAIDVARDRLSAELMRVHHHAEALGARNSQIAAMLEDMLEAAIRFAPFQAGPSWRLLRGFVALERRLPRLARLLVALPDAAIATLRLRLRAWLKQQMISRRLFATGLFDSYWYAIQYPHTAVPGLRPIDHWIISGRGSRYQPNPLFDVDYYLAQVPGLDPLSHDPLWHYYEEGAARGLDPHPLFHSAWYLDQNPDVGKAGHNPLGHYLQTGAREGRDPNALFQSSWYARTQARSLKNNENPLAHYLRVGARQGLKPNPWFDSAWYLEQHPEINAKGENPLVHYVTKGAALGFDPCPEFDSAWYLEHYPDVAEAGLNPLAHYLQIGMAEGRKANPEGVSALRSLATDSHARLYDDLLRNAQHGGHSSDYVEQDQVELNPAHVNLRAIAFYLPQFHPIPENDAWWGKGFTEWTNVSKAVPQFEGHNQPRLPDALGFYDLRLKQVQREQIRLARQHGIHGFCYYYYWFDGRRLLETPLLQVLADPSLDFPFCLCWANENWTRRWDGGDAVTLIGQRHSPEDDQAFFASIVDALRDSRYIRVNGRALLLVYRPGLLPDPAATLSRWRAQARAAGLGELHLGAVLSFDDGCDALAEGFDMLVDFPPLSWPRTDASADLPVLNQYFSGHILDYAAAVAEADLRYGATPIHPAVAHPGVMLAWDNTARRGGAATIFAGATPEGYARWLAAAGRQALARDNPDERLVFINAWNEWAEGTYLEPDRRYGFAWLQATRGVLAELSGVCLTPGDGSSAQGQKTRPSLLYIGHDAHKHGAQLLTLHLVRLFKRRFGYRVHLWLLGEGELLSAYREVAVPLQVFSPDDRRIASAAREVAAAGVSGAIANTLVTASVIPELAAAGIPVLSLIHEMAELIRERGLESQARCCASQASRIVFASNRVKESLASVTQSGTQLEDARCVILPQGVYQALPDIDTDSRAAVAAELGMPAEAILVINLGYGDRRKGIDWFLSCACATVAADSRFHFLWVGNIEDAFRQAWEQERKHPVHGGHLHHLDFTDQVGRYYAAANVFLLTSREDPFPSVVLEALCCGLPVVAFAGTGGHCDLLTPAETDLPNGTLVEPLGDIQALTQAVLDTVAAEAAHPHWARARAIAARQRFDFAAYAWNLVRLLDLALQSVSILVPNYNYAHYIAERLRSLFNQGYPVFEIIVLDDASSDASEPEIRRVAEAHGRDITLVANRENSGSVFVQWARGVLQARGDFIWIAEADDLAQADFLERLVPAFVEHPDLLFAFCDSQQIDEAGALLGDSYADYCNAHAELDFRADFTVSGKDFLRQALSVKNTILNVSAVLFRREALIAGMRRLGWIDAEQSALDTQAASRAADWRIAGDWRLYIELCRIGGQVAYHAAALNQHRRHRASVVGSHQLGHHAEEIARMHRELRADVGADPAIAERQRGYLSEIQARARQSPA